MCKIRNDAHAFLDSTALFLQMAGILELFHSIAYNTGSLISFSVAFSTEIKDLANIIPTSRFLAFYQGNLRNVAL